MERDSLGAGFSFSTFTVLWICSVADLAVSLECMVGKSLEQNLFGSYMGCNGGDFNGIVLESRSFTIYFMDFEINFYQGITTYCSSAGCFWENVV